VGGRPQIEAELRVLIRRMSLENAQWARGELLKLGFEVAQSSVAKYMIKRRGGCRFCRIHEALRHDFRRAASTTLPRNITRPKT
jgi:hypothetical protein